MPAMRATVTDFAEAILRLEHSDCHVGSNPEATSGAVIDESVI
jgi:hypothetical protein